MPAKTEYEPLRYSLRGRPAQSIFDVLADDKEEAEKHKGGLFFESPAVPHAFQGPMSAADVRRFREGAAYITDVLRHRPITEKEQGSIRPILDEWGRVWLGVKVPAAWATSRDRWYYVQMGPENNVEVSADPDGDSRIFWSDDDELSISLAGNGVFVFSSTGLTVPGLGDGGLTSYDLKVGDVTTPDYGMIQMGDASIGRTSYKAGNIDADGAVIFRNIGGPVTGQVEFLFGESSGSSCRFAIPSSGVGNATYNPRSMLLAGPAPADTDFVTVGYWQTNNSIFDNLVCDTAGAGADLGVQNDLEVEGDIFTDSMKESTTDAGISFSHDIHLLAGVTITSVDDVEVRDVRVLEILEAILEEMEIVKSHLAEMTGEDIGPEDVEEP